MAGDHLLYDLPRTIAAGLYVGIGLLYFNFGDVRPRRQSLVRLRRGFFARYSPTVAKELIGCRLVRVVDGTRLSGIVVETEAYRGARDPASHAYRRKTRRNEVMFGPAGVAYVYFTMGAHYCLNVTTEKKDAAAVLIRAVLPMEGVERMKRNRGVTEPTEVASGPGKLTRAFEIDRSLNG